MKTIDSGMNAVPAPDVKTLLAEAMDAAKAFFAFVDNFEQGTSEVSVHGNPLVAKILSLTEDIPAEQLDKQTIKATFGQLISVISEKTPMGGERVNRIIERLQRVSTMF